MIQTGSGQRMAQQRRVVITGMATINPLGDDLDVYYNNLIAGKSGVKRWSTLDTSNVDCKIGGDLGDYDCAAALEKLRETLDPDLHKRLRKLFRTMTLPNKTATLCAIKAWRDAGLFDTSVRPADDRISVMVGGHNFNSRYVLEQNLQFLKEPAFIDPLYGIEALDPNIPGTICEVLGARGPALESPPVVSRGPRPPFNTEDPPWNTRCPPFRSPSTRWRRTTAARRSSSTTASTTTPMW